MFHSNGFQALNSAGAQIVSSLFKKQAMLSEKRPLTFPLFTSISFDNVSYSTCSMRINVLISIQWLLTQQYVTLFRKVERKWKTVFCFWARSMQTHPKRFCFLLLGMLRDCVILDVAFARGKVSIEKLIRKRVQLWSFTLRDNYHLIHVFGIMS